MPITRHLVNSSELAIFLAAHGETIVEGGTTSGLLASTGYTPIDAHEDDAFTTLAAAGGGLERTFSTTGADLLQGTLPVVSGFTFAMEAERPTNNAKVMRSRDSHILLETDGSLRIVIKDSNNAIPINVIENGFIDATGFTHFVVQVDLSTPATPVATLHKNGLAHSASNFGAAGTSPTIPTDFLRFLGGNGNSAEDLYIGDFKRMLFDEGTALDPAVIFGTADQTTLGADYLLGGPTQRALPVASPEANNLNKAETSGAKSLTFHVGGNLAPFSEVA